MSRSSRENDDVRGVDGPAARPGPDPVPAVPPSAHQAVTFLELFFDLVWVFAISQLSEHLLDHRTWRGAGETLVMALAMFVIWSFTAYESTMVLARKSEARWIVLAVMAGGLVMNASITGAFEDTPWAFVVPMVLIQVGRSAMTRVHDDYDSLRHHRVSMIVWAAVSAVPWVLGAAGGPGRRLYWWLAAVLIDVVGMWSGHPVPGRRRRDFSEVRFDVEHQVERCRLFLIICLGEGVLTTGRSIARGPQDPARLAAGLLSLAVLIGVPKEPHTRESLVAATPDTVGKLIGLGYDVCVEKDAGLDASYLDEQYRQAGAQIVTKEQAWGADVVTCLDTPPDAELALVKAGATLVCRVDPDAHSSDVEVFSSMGITVLAMDAVPRISRAQSMDVRSSMANIAG